MDVERELEKKTRFTEPIYNRTSRQSQYVRKGKSIIQSLNYNKVYNIALAGIVAVLAFSQFQLGARYKKMVMLLEQQGIIQSEDSGGSTSKIEQMENKLVEVENNLSKIMGQFEWNFEETGDTSLPAGASNGNPNYKEYVVQKGDTLWSISVRLYGDGKRSKELMEINGFSESTILQDGQVILVPKN
ncbi:MAG: LysM peptidoglycan-binding domain-containing protein [Clostridiaceae bacterium]|nr:LysM peptidoglycan-binding domain-containing protein [Clostridiaceae bacterium]